MTKPRVGMRVSMPDYKGVRHTGVVFAVTAQQNVAIVDEFGKQYIDNADRTELAEDETPITPAQRQKLLRLNKDALGRRP